MSKLHSRREVLSISLKSIAATGAAFLVGPTFLASCKKFSDNKDFETAAKTQVTIEKCPGTEDLLKREKSIRTALKYVDQTPDSTRTCDNCKLYTRPLEKYSCGGCKIVPGPIHPKGYCTAWFPQM